jgi:hypothetical protein
MLAQAYHWTLEDVKKLSYVQVLMLQHAANFNRKVLDKKLEEGRKNNSQSFTEGLADGAQDISKLTSEELFALAGNENGKAPKVIKIRKDQPDVKPNEQGS